MSSKLFATALAAALSVPALAQSTTTTTTNTPAPTQPPGAQQPAAPGTSQQPAAPGTSQQVVVSPPAAPAPAAPVVTAPAPAPAPAPQTVIVDRGVPRTSTVIVEERRSTRSPMSIVATNALYGGAAGAVIGAGIALINQGDNWGRDLMIGTGLGVLAGAAVGAVTAYNQQPDRVALDGLGTPARDRGRQRPMTQVASYALRW